MKLENYTIVKLKNGKEGAIVEVFENAYFVDISDAVPTSSETDDILTVHDEDISQYLKNGKWHNLT